MYRILTFTVVNIGAMCKMRVHNCNLSHPTHVAIICFNFNFDIDPAFTYTGVHLNVIVRI